jgi:hypothetical protein
MEMSKTLNIFRHALLAASLVLLFGLTGCSDDASTSGGPLPQPTIDCDGSSCID